MPLSEEEARLLAQLEQSLAAEDPDLASTLRGSKLAAHVRRTLLLSIVGFVAGLVTLLGGTIAQQVWLGVLGFVAMVACAYVFARAWRRGQMGGSDRAPKSKGSKPSGGSFVDRMEERWNRRRDDQGI